MDNLSMNHEDYLEAMVMLGAAAPGASVRTVDVATKLGVSKASVNKAVGILQEKGFVEHLPYGDIKLTADGVSYGTKVLDRHNALKLFLNKAIGIDDETAEVEACKMEHAISDASFEKWMRFIKSLDL